MPPVPEPPIQWPIPTFQVHIEDLAHAGARFFLDTVKPLDALETAVKASFTLLYHTLDACPKEVSHILLVLRSMPGVAHTFGTETHKTIHFSLDHIERSASKHEIMGVLVHEVVHCYQYDANGTAPGGLIEGFADYVRMHSDLAPPHWSRSFPPHIGGKNGDHWDSGYEKTAYFLDWLEKRYGDGTVRELNLLLKDKDYEKAVWKEVTGRRISKLWRIYCEDVGAIDNDDDDDDDLPVPDTLGDGDVEPEYVVIGPLSV